MASRAENLAMRNKLASELIDRWYGRLDQYQAAMVGDVNLRTALREEIEGGMRAYAEYVFKAEKESKENG